MPASAFTPVPPAFEPVLMDTLERYFDLLQHHVPAERMRAEILTDDFETGFVGGFMWRGEEGLRDFLHDRSPFFDESHEILQILDVRQERPAVMTARTRLRFFLRGRDEGAAYSTSYTGEAFHTWRLAREERGPRGGRWRVAAQLVDGFAALNGPARTLFSAP